jgi:AraC-like DNA-binding protein
MEREKPYLDPDLTIGVLSEKVKIPDVRLSLLLNNEINRNFFDFINSYRIEEFKKQVKNPENNNLSLLGIALNCGFNSKATFNRVFKKYTEMTPKEYKNRVDKTETYFLEK